MIRELYRRIVNAIVMWLAIHFPKVFLPALLDAESHPLLKPFVAPLYSLSGPDALDFSGEFNYALLRKLFADCPKDHIITCVRRIGFSYRSINISQELEAAYQLYLLNGSLIGNYTSHHPGNCPYSKTRIADELPQVFSEYFMVPKPKGEFCYPFDRHLRTRVNAAVYKDYLNYQQGLNLIVGWKYYPISQDEQ